MINAPPYSIDGRARPEAVATTAVAPPLPLDPMSHMPDLPREAPLKRLTMFAIALLIAGGYLFCVLSYWQPINEGVDQNGYLVGGKLFAQTLSMRQSPRVIGTDTFDPHQFVARMWVAASNNPHDFFPKYPLGLPLIYAVCLWVGGSHGVELAYLVSPVAMSLGVLGVFFLGRRFGGSLAGLLAMLVFATSPATSALVNNPNSHATTVFCVVWGMNLLLHWWRYGGRLWAFGGGLLTGYAFTIRYTEGALLLPLLWVVFMRLPWRSLYRRAGRQLPTLESAEVVAAGPAQNPGDEPQSASAIENVVPIGTAEPTEPLTNATAVRAGITRAVVRHPFTQSAVEGGLAVVGWLIPVVGLLVHNRIEMGTWTGYDATRESTGFSWDFFYDNWETILRQLSENGMFLIFPIAIAGLIAMFWWDWRRAVFMWLWIGPCLSIYSFYYWAPDSVGYLRFVVTAIPPLLVGGFWVLAHVRDLLPLEPRRVAIVPMLLVLVVVAAAAGTAGYWVLRLDLIHHRFIPTAEYLYPPDTTWYATTGAGAVLAAAVVMFATWMAIISAAFFLGRSIVTTLAAGAVAFLSVAVQVDNSAQMLESQSVRSTMRLVDHEMIRKNVPEGSVIICRDNSLLHHLQFTGDYVLYNGETFDKRRVERQMLDTTSDPADPELMDPVRAKSIFATMADMDQKAIDALPESIVRRALDQRRRVFVIDRMNVQQYYNAVRSKKPPPLPEFVRRYLSRKPQPGERAIIADVNAVWNIPVPVESVSGRGKSRGRKNRQTRFNPASMGIVEVKLK